MCKYCAKVKDDNEDFEFFVDESAETNSGVTFMALDASLTNIDGPTMWITTYIGDKAEELIDAYVRIRYCPFCGEKLV